MREDASFTLVSDVDHRAARSLLARSVESPRVLDHRLEPLRNKPAGTLLVHEIYASIQGESTFAGLPCVFVRLTACNLRCGYCDTPHAFREGRVIILDDLVRETLSHGIRLVELTGGEPLLQRESFELMTRLADAGSTVLLETGGSLDIAQVDARVRTILDIKTPGSGECEANYWPNLDRLKPIDEVKFVICDQADFDWTLDVVARHGLLERVTVLVSPACGQVEPARLADWVLRSGRALRLQLQMHKFIWDPNRRGV